MLLVNSLGALRIERPEMPVIVLTGQGSLETLLSVRREGAYAFLRKPADIGQLKSVLASALAKGNEERIP